MKNIAFLGLGAMGSRMAKRLLNAGFTLTAWNRSEGPADTLVQLGATKAATIEEAVAKADATLVMVADDAASEVVWNKAMAAATPQCLLVDMSTISTAQAKALASRAKQMGNRFLEAPVAGSRPQAEAGELVFLMGGQEEAIQAFTPLSDAMGKAALHIGGAGHGAAFKLVVNGLLAAQTAVMAEVIALMKHHDLSPESHLPTLAKIPVTAPAGAVVSNLMLQEKHDPMFPIDLLRKDLDYLLRDTKAELFRAIDTRFAEAQSKGLGDKHISAVAALT